ncbi:MAG: CDGSH iron-sulfur domain-containing protein [Burkholderiales bacterium]|nr:CDGSH iron-sulfur domain-containing protein [Burkholderiales bacterium]
MEPFVIDLNPATYYFCSCGKSGNLPYCDGAHKDTALQPFQVELKEAKKVGICSCRKSKTSPFCDGTHLSLD